MLSQEEQNRENAQQLKDLAAQVLEVDDLTATLHDQLETLSRNTLLHIQSILMAYQSSIQDMAPIIETKTG